MMTTVSQRRWCLMIRTTKTIAGISKDPKIPPSLSSPGDPELRLKIYPPIEDEQTVNTALLSFISALIAHAGLPLQWSLHRVPLKAYFTDTRYEACVPPLRCIGSVYAVYRPKIFLLGISQTRTILA